jgi:hypothetical protein
MVELDRPQGILKRAFSDVTPVMLNHSIRAITLQGSAFSLYPLTFTL